VYITGVLLTLSQGRENQWQYSIVNRKTEKVLKNSFYVA